jgi:hypothetical protein
MQRFTPCAQQPRGVTGPLAGSRAELEGMFCPEAPRGPDGDSDPTGGGGGPSPYSGVRSIHVEDLGLSGGDCIHGGSGSTHGGPNPLVKSFGID